MPVLTCRCDASKRFIPLVQVEVDVAQISKGDTWLMCPECRHVYKPLADGSGWTTAGLLEEFE